MTHRAWITCFVLSAEVALVATPRLARACGGGDEDVAEFTTFDPHVIGRPIWEGLYYDPHLGAFGGPCADCPEAEMLDDWAGYLGPAVKREDWKKVLFSADLAAIDGLIFKLQKKKPAIPRGFEKSTVLAGDPAKLIAALYLVGFARRVEPFGAAPPEEWDQQGTAAYQKKLKAAGDPASLQAAGEKQLAKIEDPFLRQRYAFQLLRLRFHRKDWPAVVKYHEEQATTLEAPSASLKWRALYYRAGALRRSGDRARANLELARIHAAFPALAGSTAHDFSPLERADWSACLALAANAGEKAALWQLVGLKLDPLGALEQVIALEPSGERAELLVVREIARSEGDAAALAKLEAIAGKIAAAKGTHHPWVFELVAAHVAALRGDLARARARLERAAAARPNDALVAKQRSATLAIAIAASWKAGEPKLEDELAMAMGALDDQYTRSAAVRSKIVELLRPRFLKAGKKVEAELLRSGRPYGDYRAASDEVIDAKTIEGLMVRVEKPVTALDRVLVASAGYTRTSLARDLAIVQLVSGDLDAAHATFTKFPDASEKLGTDPFVMHVVDCHDCDHERFGASSKWTHASFAAKLRELKAQAAGTGEPAAKAAFALGSGLYNLTYYGNARVVTRGTPAVTADTAPAEAAFKRAFELTADKELKAKAAYMAAKCELSRYLESPDEKVRGNGETLPVPKTWFVELKKLAETKYHAEVLKECGHYRRWKAKS